MLIVYRVGFWPEKHADEKSWSSDLPVPTHPKMIDPSWFGEYRDNVIRYLRSGHEESAELGFSWCRFRCGCDDSTMGCRYLTDGLWYWPEGLHHYINDHDVILPELFIAQMQSNSFRMPSKPDWISWPYERIQNECRFDDSAWKDWYHRRIST